MTSLPELGTLDRRKLAALVGLAPFNNDSGSSRGKRSIRGGRAEVRAVLLHGHGHCRAVQPDYPRDVHASAGSGQGQKVALIACARKLLTILNAMVHNNTPWKLEAA
jgi:transposase